MKHTRTEHVFMELSAFYELVKACADYMKRPRDYGTGTLLNTVEIHTLSLIADNPGLCVSDVAQTWGRTLGAASRNVNRLQAKGYIQKVKHPDNDKNVHLYVTATGKKLSELHKQFDKTDVMRDAEQLLEKHTVEELDIFFSVISSLREIIDTKQ